MIHGAKICIAFTGVYYIWDEVKQVAVRHVFKLDQIIENTNKQDGVSVLALTEAFLEFVSKEFPTVTEIGSLQMDNAGAYHTKELVIGIAILNFKMISKGGPVIRRIIHTETQEGKTLLDAHFAHATFHVIRYLKRTCRKTESENCTKNATTPSELVTALLSNGGMSNCAVQLDNIQRGTSENPETLDLLLEKIKNVSAKLQLYFTRANEIVYDTVGDFKKFYSSSEPIEVGSMMFTMKVFAYSNIGTGGEFFVNLKNDTVSWENCPMNKENQDTAINEALSAAKLAGANKNLETFSVGECLENSVEESDNVDLIVDGSDFIDEDILPAFSPNQGYSAQGMLTGIDVKIATNINVMVSSKIRKGKLKSSESECLCLSHYNDVQSQGTVMLYNKDYQDSDRIRCGYDKRMKEYELATNFVLPQKYKLEIGWARRTNMGETYGEKYMSKYKPEIRQMFEQGVKQSALKMNPGMMHQRLSILYPNTFRIPSETEIKSYVSQLATKEKQPGNTSFQVRTPQENETAGKIPSDIINEIDRLVTRYGGKIMPAAVFRILKKAFDESMITKLKEVITRKVSDKKKALATKVLRSCIG